jgi:hypothetical protein
MALAAQPPTPTQLAPQPCAGEGDKISHIDMENDHIDTAISHIITPYPISMTMSHTDNPIGIPFVSHLTYRSSISISHIDIESYLVTLVLGAATRNPGA